MHLSLRPVPMSLRPLAAALLCAWAGLAFAADPLGDPNPTHLFVLEEGQAVVGTLQRVSARYEDTVPGIGRMFVQAMFARDYPLLMGILRLGSVMVVIFNLVADIVYGVLDPRIRYE